MVESRLVELTGNLREAAGAAETDAASIERRRAFHRVARLGLGARAVVYAVTAVLCADIAARGSSPASPDGSGALSEVARQRAGPALLVVLAIGLLGYPVWRLVQAVAPIDRRTREHVVRRVGLALSGIVYLALFVQAIELLLGAGHRSSGSNPEPVAAVVLRWPGGSVILGFAAAVLAAGGVGLIVWGVRHDYAAVLDRERMGEARFRASRVAGIVGDSVRGALVVLLAGYGFAAAFDRHASEVKGIDAALATLAHRPGGVELVSLAALGLFAFALATFAEACYRRM